MSSGRPRGHGGHMSAEKAKDFKTAMKRLLNYMKRYRLQLVVMMVFAVGSTIFNIVGPKVLGKATYVNPRTVYSHITQVILCRIYGNTCKSTFCF